MKKACLLFILVLIFTGSVFSQMNPVWKVVYPGQGIGLFSEGLDVDLDDSLNIYTTGFSDDGSMASAGDVFYDYVTMKINQQGNIRWVANCNGPGYVSTTDFSKISQLDNRGNVYVAARLSGSVYSPIVKYNNSGNLQWLFTDSLPSTFYSIELDDSSHVYACGTIVEPLALSPGISLLKLDSSGSVLWKNEVPDSLATNGCYDLSVNNNHFTCVTGYGSTSPCWDWMTAGFSPGGIIPWYHEYWDTSCNTGQSFRVTSDNTGNFYVLGFEWNPDLNANDVIIRKVDQNGTPEYVSTYSNPYNQVSTCQLSVGRNGNCYAVFDGVDSHSVYGFYLTKTNSSGGLSWDRFYSDFDNPIPEKIIVQEESNSIYVLSGSFKILNYDTSGTLRWVYSGPPGLFAKNMIADSLNNFYITGTQDSTYYMMFVMKLAMSTTGIQLNQVPFFSIYPNPAREEIVINNPGGGYKFSGIYNLLGEQVVDHYSPDPANDPVFHVDISKITPGVYVVEMGKDGQLFHSKFIKE